MAGLAATVALVASVGPAPATTKAQRFFADELRRSGKVSADVKRNLADGKWRVDRDVIFADVTGEGRSDAIVRVYSGTSANDVAAYVLSSRKGQKLRVLFARENLYRVTISTRGRLLRLNEARFSRGDPTCCPRAFVEKAYRWERDRFVLRNTRRIDAPAPGIRR